MSNYCQWHTHILKLCLKCSSYPSVRRSGHPNACNFNCIDNSNLDRLILNHAHTGPVRNCCCKLFRLQFEGILRELTEFGRTGSLSMTKPFPGLGPTPDSGLMRIEWLAMRLSMAMSPWFKTFWIMSSIMTSVTVPLSISVVVLVARCIHIIRADSN